jgi:hypothetical protein
MTKKTKGEIIEFNEPESSDNKQLATTDLLTNAMQNLNQSQIELLSEKAAEEALRLQVKNRDQLMDSEIARRETLDHIDAFNNLSKDGRLTRNKMTSVMKTASGYRKIESKSGAGCFVATSAFESAEHPTVVNLRLYRDVKLRKSNKGIKFINWYYKNGPHLAKLLDSAPIFKPLVRVTLNRISRFLCR